MRAARWFLLLLPLWALGRPAHAQPEKARVTVWVDAQAPAGGTGTARAPWRTLQEALGAGRPATIRVKPGRYAGPFLLPDGAQLIGDGPGVVLTSSQPVDLVQVEGHATLENLTLEGGVRSLVLAEAGSAALSRVHIVGPQRDGVVAVFHEPRSGLTLDAEQLTIDGAPRGVRLVKAGDVRLRQVRIHPGAADGLFCARTHLVLDDVQVDGHEYGLSFGEGARVEGSGLVSRNARRAGIAAVGDRVLLRDVEVEGAGDFGGLQVIASHLWLERFRIDAAKSYGVLLESSWAELREGAITGTSDPDGVTGDGIQLRGSIAQLSGLHIRRSSDDGLLAAEGSSVQLSDVAIADSGSSGLVVETRASVVGRAVRIESSRSTGLTVVQGRVVADGWIFADNAEGPIQAQCGRGAQVRLRDVTFGPQDAVSSLCVSPGPAVQLQPWPVQQVVGAP